ncbi:protease HtpX [Buchnera aphidicola]|uniref:Protease HtpX n=1 Tax=Buchnera aphidicola (Anoecia oenotherae) TaxID=1241833 RepID=A0A4D6XY46_9GAMM|nr:protease HtpX [Buchnera aphidicola]QCI19378.1 protease HtpX [Buchnera aphidicola (Anoecia oenotherae)]
MMRIMLFLLTNISVMLVFGFLLFIVGIKQNSIESLMIMSVLCGFGGSFLSLIFSKWIALQAVNGVLVKQAKTEQEEWLIKTIKKYSEIVGITPPEISIYPSLEINAFATGARRNSALIAVTTGLLQNMNKSEAEAVIAHEISHIANGDMVTMTLIQGTVNTFVIFFSRIVATIVTNFISSKKNEDNINNSNYPIFYFLVSMFTEMVFGGIATIIIMWFSRNREFYADAGAAKIVGVDKMVAALKKLQMQNDQMNKGISSVTALCIHGQESFHLAKMFMSHPPLKKRIEALYNRDYL